MIECLESRGTLKVCCCCSLPVRFTEIRFEECFRSGNAGKSAMGGAVHGPESRGSGSWLSGIELNGLALADLFV